VLGSLNIFRKKKKEKEKAYVEPAKVMTELEKLCGDDRETYEALLNTMFLDPGKLEVSMKEAVKNAEKFEKAKDSLRAKVWYEIAGGLAIYEGDVKKVAKFLSKCEKISPGTKYPILKNPKTAVAKAQEYYKKNLKA
jgi:hypothetical protein